MKVSIEFEDNEFIDGVDARRLSIRLERAIAKAVAPWGGKLGTPRMIFEKMPP